jgi:hypothetical protein
MKKCLLLLAGMLFIVASMAQNADYLLKKDFQTEKKKITEGIDIAKKTGFDAKKIVQKQAVAFDSLTKALTANQKLIQQSNDSMQKATAQFTYLSNRVSKISTKTKYYLRLIVILMAVSFVLLLALIYFFKKRTDEKLQELSNENMKLSELVKQEIVVIKDEMQKASDSLLITMKEHLANFSAMIEKADERHQSSTTRMEQEMDKIVKEQVLYKTTVDEKVMNMQSVLNADKTEHQHLQEKIDMEVLGLRNMHKKDVEEIKAKL